MRCKALQKTRPHITPNVSEIGTQLGQHGLDQFENPYKRAPAVHLLLLPMHPYVRVLPQQYWPQVSQLNFSSHYR